MFKEETVKPKYDLLDRTFDFAKRTRVFIKSLPKTIVNLDDAKQVLRSSGSVGANYIEACEALSKKDFSMRIKICRKEAKESVYWFRLIEAEGVELEKERKALLQESMEFTKIFGAIVSKK